MGVGVKIISSNDIMCHVHSHPPSHHIGKILDGQSLISGKRVLVVNHFVAKLQSGFDMGFCPKLPRSSMVSQAVAATF